MNVPKRPDPRITSTEHPPSVAKWLDGTAYTTITKPVSVIEQNDNKNKPPYTPPKKRSPWWVWMTFICQVGGGGLWVGRCMDIGIGWNWLSWI